MPKWKLYWIVPRDNRPQKKYTSLFFGLECERPRKAKYLMRFLSSKYKNERNQHLLYSIPVGSFSSSVKTVPKMIQVPIQRNLKIDILSQIVRCIKVPGNICKQILNPCWLSSFGGFQWPSRPFFPINTQWMQRHFFNHTLAKWKTAGREGKRKARGQASQHIVHVEVHFQWPDLKNLGADLL